MGLCHPVDILHVLFLRQMSTVTYINESCHIYDFVMSHICMSLAAFFFLRATPCVNAVES